MTQKLTLEEFREIKKGMIELVETAEEKYSSKTEEEDAGEKFLIEYNALQNRLLSSDLSDIPFEEWKGLFIFTDGELDLSKTHANIDFSLLAGIEYETINFNGCNIRGIEAIEYDENTFDAEFMKAHPEYFPDESIPSEIRQLFYDRKLSFSDIIRYPALRKCVNEHSFDRAYTSPSRELVKAIGFEYAIRLFDEYPEFVKSITYEDGDAYMYDKFNFSSETPFDKSKSYEEAKLFIYNQIIDEVIKGYSKDLPPLDVLPQEMIEKFPNVFIKDGELPEEVVKNYYKGKLSISEIRQYSEVLKTKNLGIGTHSSSEIQAINRIFGDVWKFIEQVPMEFDDIIGEYLAKYAYEEEELKKISQQSLQEIISDSVRHALNDYSWSRRYYDLDELYAFSQYIPMEEVFEEANVRNFVQRCGFKNIIEFNRKNNELLDRTGDSYGSSTLLQEMAKYVDVIGDEVIENEEQLAIVIGKIIHQMRTSEDYSIKNIIEKNKEELITLYPNEFLNYNELNGILKDTREDEKRQIIERLEKGLNGKTDSILEVLNQYPQLLPALKGKSLIIGKNDWVLDNLYQKVGSERFLEICSKYGKSLLQVTNYIKNENQNTEDFISKMDEDNYEQQMNQFIYNMLSKNNSRDFDIRILPPSFRNEHPDLYLDENAPKELQDSFYGKKYFGSSCTLLGTKDIHEHPEWIPYLMKVDLKRCLDSQMVNVYASKGQVKAGYAYSQRTNIYEALELVFSKEETLDFIAKYGHCINNSTFDIDVSINKEEQYKRLVDNIYVSIKNRQLIHNKNNMPIEFIEQYPDIFLDDNAPEELQNLFYQRKINPEIIQDHPEWKEFLQGKDISAVCDYNLNAFVKKCMQLGFDNNKIFELFDKYGSYLASCKINIDNLNNNNIGELDNVIKQQIVDALIVQRVKYNESAREIIGQEHPELFLDENAPEELKEVFYNYTYNTPLTFELLKQHREWLPHLEGKNVLLSLKKRNMGTRGLEQLFQKYGDQEAIRIGMKNPESVMQMLSENKYDILASWYDRLHFIPHHTVMKEFPFEQIDKFIASGKKWSQITRIEEFNINDDTKAALLKASMCFGVFDNDIEGFNKLIQLFTEPPKTLSLENMQKIEDYINEQIKSLGDNPDPQKLEEYNKKLELVQKNYIQIDNKTFELKIGLQQDKNTINNLIKILLEADVQTVLTPDKAHKLFGGFEMQYKPDFRDFILKNMDTILSSDEYIAYISSMQKQWESIKALNSNRVLTLDLAMAFVKSNNYDNVQMGNQRLAEVSNMAGYDQNSFNILQQIYNYGKSRTFSSIPRINNKSGEYTYEILRLDDPLAVAIGTLTDCCQELGNAAETSMEHSMVDKNGRVFVIKDEEGNIVAQSWVWRNKNVLCFDNIEIPSRAFTRATRKGYSRGEFTDTIFALYQQAGKELIAKDEEEFKKLLEEGKITEEQYEALKLGKVTVGTGYNDIAESLKKNAPPDKSVVARPLEFTPPVILKNGIYTNDSETQYVIAGEQDVPTSDYETPTIYSDEFEIHDNNNTKQQDTLILQKLELATKQDNYTGRTQSDETEKIVSDIAYNYGLNPDTTRIIMNANFAIIYEATNDEIIIGDILYNTSFENHGYQVDITDKVTMQIRMALEQIGVQGKKLNTSRLDKEQQELCNRAMSLEAEIDEERGLSHGAR